MNDVDHHRDGHVGYVGRVALLGVGHGFQLLIHDFLGRSCAGVSGKVALLLGVGTAPVAAAHIGRTLSMGTEARQGQSYAQNGG